MLMNSSLPGNFIEDQRQTEEGGSGPVSDGCRDVQAVLPGEEADDRNVIGGRWPLEETIALLKIRSHMDVAFRDITPKILLWEQVSRRLQELGYNRSAKKCEEKFKNMYKYYRRTKEGRYGRPNGKTYRFFKQLEPLLYPEKNEEQRENTAKGENIRKKKRKLTESFGGLMNEVVEKQEKLQKNFMEVLEQFEQGRIAREETWKVQELAMFKRERELLAEEILSGKDEEQTENTTKSTTPMELSNVIQDAIPFSTRFPSDPSSSTTFSWSEESGENIGKKKRKLTQVFERLINEVVDQQEKLQKNFMEKLDKFEQDRIAREEAWKVQELAMIKRECELLAEERSIAAAKDAAMLALLRKFTERAGPLQLPENILPNDEDKDEQENDNAGSSVIEKQECRNVGDFTQVSPTSSRWPKDEVEALIKLRTNLGVENEGNGLKGSPWEEISCAMKELGYDRSAKKCREKWENMNKYFKRMKENNKTKPEDSKTCPYFHQLDALYNCEKPNREVNDSASPGKDQLKPEELLMHILEGQSRSSSEDAD